MDYEVSLTEAGFTRRQRVDRAVHTLEGILRGIALDAVITSKELEDLRAWANDQRALVGFHPFSELVPKIDAVLADEVIDADEHEDLLWVCKNLQFGSTYYDETTSDMQRLQGILHGMLADGAITEDEIRQLSLWVADHSDLKGCYPYDETDALLTQVLRDGRIDSSEREMLKLFFEDFITYSLSRRIHDARTGVAPPRKLTGICAVCPELVFPRRTYSFTGASVKAKRSQMASNVEALGGRFSKSVTPSVHYLIVCAEGNPAWAYACYGRKVEEAMNLRAAGHSVVIVHETDFWDALQDQKTT